MLGIVAIGVGAEKPAGEPKKMDSWDGASAITASAAPSWLRSPSAIAIGAPPSSVLPALEKVPLPAPARRAIESPAPLENGTARSGLPSPFSSAMPTATGEPPSAIAATGPKVPVPVPKNMDSLDAPFEATTSRRPSWLRSAAASAFAVVPIARLLTNPPKPPAPLPRPMPRLFWLSAAMTRSRAPFELKSPSASARVALLVPTVAPVANPPAPFPTNNATVRCLK